MAANDLAAFGEKLSELDGLKEVDLAVALLWFFDHEGQPEIGASKLASVIHDLALRNQVNSSRLAKNLARSSDVVRGRKSDTFRLKLSRKSALSDKYLPLLKRPRPKIEDHIISSEDFEGTGIYFAAIVRQVNGCYQDRFYDGCIVLCRRLTESLLIEAFERNGKGDEIKRSGDYVPLKELIAIAQSGHVIKLSRGVGKSLLAIKEAGDAGAHSRAYVTKQTDIDDLKFSLRRAVAELMKLAKIEPAKS